jgi:hypothetical protein
MASAHALPRNCPVPMPGNRHKGSRRLATSSRLGEWHGEEFPRCQWKRGSSSRKSKWPSSRSRGTQQWRPDRTLPSRSDAGLLPHFLATGIAPVDKNRPVLLHVQYRGHEARGQFAPGTMRRLKTGQNFPLVAHDSPHCNEGPKYQTAHSFRNQTSLVQPKKPAGLRRRAPYAVTLLPRGLGGFRDWSDASGRKLRIGGVAAQRHPIMVMPVRFRN